MDSFKKPRKLVSCENIYDLPEQVIREILKLVGYETSWFTLREVCSELKKHVEKYLEFGGIFLLTGFDCNPCKIIHIFKPCSKKLDSRYELIPDISQLLDTHLEKTTSLVRYPSDLRQYSGFLVDVHSPMDIVMDSTSNIYFGDKIMFYSYNLSSLCFDYNTRKWNSLRGVPCCRSDYRDNRWRLAAYSRNMLFYFQNNSLRNYLNIIYFNSGCCKEFKSSLCTCKYQVDIPQKLKSLEGYSIMRYGAREIVVVGGYYRRLSSGTTSTTFTKDFNQLLWYGKLAEDGRTMNWRSTDLGTRALHISPICFKLKNNLYIVGEKTFYDDRKDSKVYKSCRENMTSGIRSMVTGIFWDRYDMEEDKYYQNIYFLPSFLNFFFKPNIVTDSEENFAVITFWNKTRCINDISNYDKYSESIWIFTESDGFSECSNLETEFEYVEIWSPYHGWKNVQRMVRAIARMK